MVWLCDKCHEKFDSKEEALKHEKSCKIIFSIEIPGEGILTFHPKFVSYEGIKIDYSDLTSISYLMTSKYINGIPSGTDYDIEMNSKKDHISLNSSSFWKKTKEKKEAWITIVNILDTYIAPMIALRLAKEIFEEGKSIIIGEVEFNKEGYSANSFWGKRKEVFWNREVFKPNFSQGEVILYWKKGEEVKTLKRISMSTDNAVVIPYLIEACVFYSANKKTGKKRGN